MGTRVNVVLNVGEQEVVLFTNTTSFDVQEVVLEEITKEGATLESVLISLLSFKQYSPIADREEGFCLDVAPYGDSEFIIDVRYDESNKLYMEAIWDNYFHFGIHSNNQNLSTFVFRKTVCVRDMAEAKTSHDFDIIYGRDILEEDKDEVRSIAIDLISSDGGKEFNSVSGNTFRVVKLTEEEMSNFLR